MYVVSLTLFNRFSFELQRIYTGEFEDVTNQIWVPESSDRSSNQLSREYKLIIHPVPVPRLY